MAGNPDLVDKKLGKYHLLRKLGRGATAEVYLAETDETHEYAAIKVLRQDLPEEQREKLLKRFYQEAKAARSLVHPNVVQVLDIGEQDGFHYIAQEYVQGRNLQKYIQDEGTPSLPQSLHIMKCVLSGLQAAAEAGIVHRDIKPDNILLTHTGEVKVTDFGLAQLTEVGEGEASLTMVGTTLGTPMYMSPEQVRGSKLDHRSDLYSFGVTCYHMLAGRPPFTGSNPMSVAIKHVNHAPKPLGERKTDLPVGLCEIVDKLMAKKADERYPTARHVLRELKEVILGLQGKSSGVTKAPPKATGKQAPKASREMTETRPATPVPPPSDTPDADDGSGQGGTPSAIAHEPVPTRPDWMHPGERKPREPRKSRKKKEEPVLEEPELIEDETPQAPAPPAVATEEDDDEGFSLRSPDTDFEEMDLTPMVDVTFLLLIFFMITASFSIQKTIQVPPPDPDKQGAAQQIQSLEELEADAIIVEIDDENGIVVDDAPVNDIRDLPDLFAGKMTSEQKNELILEAADKALHDTVIQVIDAANDVNIERIRVVTRTEAD